MNSPKLIKIGLFSIILIGGLFAAIGALSPQIKNNVLLPSTGQPRTPTSTSSPTVRSTPAEPKSRLLVSRDAYKGQALEVLAGQMATKLVCARKAYFRQQAQTWIQQTGGSEEKWMEDKLLGLQQDSVRNQQLLNGVNGETTQFGPARDRLIDLLSLLAALNDIQLGKGSGVCQVNLSVALDNINQYLAAAATYRSLKAQQDAELRRDATSPGGVRRNVQAQ